jgi:hypothetical protein
VLFEHDGRVHAPDEMSQVSGGHAT